MYEKITSGRYTLYVFCTSRIITREGNLPCMYVLDLNPCRLVLLVQIPCGGSLYREVFDVIRWPPGAWTRVASIHN